jgi:hypothetical protein
VRQFLVLAAAALAVVLLHGACQPQKRPEPQRPPEPARPAWPRR